VPQRGYTFDHLTNLRTFLLNQIWIS